MPRGRGPRETALPATRALARELGDSRGVVLEAYRQLVAEGYLTSRAGGYTRVAIGPEAAAPPEPAEAPGEREDRLQPLPGGRLALPPTGVAALGQARLERGEAGGLRVRQRPRRAGRARRAAAHLNRVRGTSASPRTS